MNQRELQSKCRAWQRRLRLQDWTVTVDLVRHAPDVDILGRVEYSLLTKCANIKITNESSLAPRQKEDGYDMEEVLVHELLHLHFVSILELESKEPSYVAQEHVINVLAHALIAGRLHGIP